MRISIINGPNLNLLGKREPEIYGNRSFDDFLQGLRKEFESCELLFFQSNHEGELVDKIQEADRKSDALIINAAAYTHTSIAIGDAVKTLAIPVIEVHISNVFAREPERHKSMISASATGVIVGLGLNGYRLAIGHILEAFK